MAQPLANVILDVVFSTKEHKPWTQWQKWFSTCCLFLLSFCSCTIYGNHPALIEQQDENTIRAILKDEISHLNIMTIKIFSEGWDNLVADINGEWIFRFPREIEFLEKLEREKILLGYLQKKLSFPIPQYQYFGLRTAFVGYPKMLGESLNEKIYLGYSEEIRQEIAESLALFLSQFHHAVSVEKAFLWGYEQYHLPLQCIEQNLLGKLPSAEIERIVNEALLYAKQNPSNSKNQVLLHNDLHGENLAFDVKAAKITGVFDFSDAAIGDYAVDFGKFFTIHHDLAIRASKFYASFNGVQDLIITAAVDHILRRAFYIIEARKNGNTLRENYSMGMLQSFVPIWDELLKNETKQ